MNDYEKLIEDLDQAIHVTETAYYNAVDEEDQAEIDTALDHLKAVKGRAEAKAKEGEAA